MLGERFKNREKRTLEKWREKTILDSRQTVWAGPGGVRRTKIGGGVSRVSPYFGLIDNLDLQYLISFFFILYWDEILLLMF